MTSAIGLDMTTTIGQAVTVWGRTATVVYCEDGAPYVYVRFADGTKMSVPAGDVR